VFCVDGCGVDEKERDRDKYENDVEDVSGFEKSGALLARLGLEHLMCV
jgi:hypothetical protein